MTGFEAYQICLAIKLHFQGKRDIKYGYMKNALEETFRARKDRFTFEKIARLYDSEYHLRCTAALLFFRNPKADYRALTDKFSVSQKYLQFEPGTFIRDVHDVDIKAFVEHNDPFELPGLLRMWVDMQVMEDTVCILFDVFNKDFDFYGRLPLPFITQFKRLMPFVVYDKAMVGAILKKELTEY